MFNSYESKIKDGMSPHLTPPLTLYHGTTVGWLSNQCPFAPQAVAFGENSETSCFIYLSGNEGGAESAACKAWTQTATKGLPASHWLKKPKDRYVYEISIAPCAKIIDWTTRRIPNAHLQAISRTIFKLESVELLSLIRSKWEFLMVKSGLQSWQEWVSKIGKKHFPNHLARDGLNRDAKLARMAGFDLIYFGDNSSDGYGHAYHLINLNVGPNCVPEVYAFAATSPKIYSI